MQFIRTHLFMIILVVATLLVVGVGLGYRFRAAGRVDDQLRARSRLASDLTNLRSNPVPADRVAAMEAYVEQTEQTFEQLSQTVLAINAQGRDVIEVYVQTLEESVPAFSTDPNHYETYYRSGVNIAWSFPEAYRRATEDLLIDLNPTTVPSAEQIGNTTNVVANQMAERLRQEQTGGQVEDEVFVPVGVAPPTPEVDPNQESPFSGLGSGISSTGGTGTSAPPSRGSSGYSNYGSTPPPGMTPPGMTPPGMTPPSGYSGSGSTYRSPTGRNVNVDMNEAAAVAIRNLQIVQAEAGQVYADFNALHLYPFAAGGAQPPMEALWEAQVQYWMHKDIVEAIRQTNDQALNELRQRTGDPVQANVLNAAVKRLVSTQMIGYELAGQTPAGAAAGVAGTTGARRGGTQTPSPTGAAGMTQAATLTQRACNTDFDVYRYQFTVVIRPQDIPVLMHEIQSNNFNCVINVTQTDASGVVESRTGRNVGQVQVDPGLYYYGPEPVVQLTVEIESRLYADWVRDLMPAEALGALLPSAALRPEDQDRLSGTTSPIGPGGMPMSSR